MITKEVMMHRSNLYNKKPHILLAKKHVFAHIKKTKTKCTSLIETLKLKLKCNKTEKFTYGCNAST